MTDPILELDLAEAGVGSIIWATGYAVDFGWLQVDAFDRDGKPRHQRGVSSEPGVYFIGLPWLSRRGSSFIWGVWHDARHVADHIAIPVSYTHLEDWYWATHSLPPLILPPQYDSEGALCQVVASGPADAQETCSLFFVEMINAAHERVWITSPYFVPDEAVMAALRLAVLRGVDVRLLIPSRPDHRTVYAASSLYALEAIRAGVKVFRYQPGFLHQKVVLVDRDTAAVGSANLDNRSFRLNFEVMVVTVDEGFAGEVEAMLEADFAESLEFTPEDRRSVRRLQQLGMRVARLVSPIL